MLRAERWLLTPLLGLALLLCATAALTTSTALVPLWVAAGLALLALPLNVWLCIHSRRKGTLAPSVDETPVARGCGLLVWALAGLAFGLALLPPLRWGLALPIGSNWDAAEFYVPLGRALQLASQRDFAQLGRNPLVTILTTPPVSGRIHAFSYLHALASSLAGVDPARSYPGMMALLLALQPPAVYTLGRAVGLPKPGALLGAALAALGWLPLWVTYNSFSNHSVGLALLPAALAGSLVALRAGGWRAIVTGALLTAGLATGYYPAMTAYVAFLGPAALYLLWSRSFAARHQVASGADELVRQEDTTPLEALSREGYSWRPTLAVARAGLALAGLAMGLSGAAQAFFFFRQGFRQEMGDAATGFQITEFVGLADGLGLSASFNRESFTAGVGLVALALAAALGLGLAAILSRRTPLLAALGLGAAVYQGYTAALHYHYGFYKGATFAVPLAALLLAAGASALWGLARRVEQPAYQQDSQAPKPKRHASGAMAKEAKPHTDKGPTVATIAPWRPGAWAVRLAACAGLGLILALNAATTWAVQARYTAAGPQLWTADELVALDLGAQVPAGASVLVVPPLRHPEVFNSLISYTLLGHELSGRFKTGYGAIDTVTNDPPPDMALLPAEAAPDDYGYRPADLRWAGGDLRLYGRAPGVRYHRAFGKGGKSLVVAPGQPLTLRLGGRRIALLGERDPEADAASAARLVLAAASFGPATLELGGAGATARYSLPGGLVQIATEALEPPAELRLSVQGDEPVYLWWGELCDAGACAAGVARRDEVFVQVVPRPAGDPAWAMADIRLHTERLPEGPQKLTAVLSAAYAPLDGNDWREIGQWVFFPNGEAPLRLGLNMGALQATLHAGDRPVDLIGSMPAPADGQYQVSLLLANDARIVYGTTLARWRRVNGAAQKPSLEGVQFDVVPLPRPATMREVASADGLIRLEGYTLPGTRARPGAELELTLVWQSLKKIDGDLRARVVLSDAQGRTLAEQTQPLGAPEHGTHSWQEGELAEQRVALAVPNSAAGAASLSVELLGPDGRPLPFRDGAGRLPIAELTVVR